MSSHHIVRDQQEPAVVIHRLEHFPIPILHALLEWSPTVVCCEPSIDFYIQQGLKLDVALLHNLNYEFWKNKLEEQQPIQTIAISDCEFLTTGLTLLKKSNHKSANIVSERSALFEVVQSCLQWVPDMDVVIFTEAHRHVLHRFETFKKWLPARTDIFISEVNNSTHFTTTGFEANLTNDSLAHEIHLTTKQDGEVTIRSNNTPFLVSEYLLL